VPLDKLTKLQTAALAVWNNQVKEARQLYALAQIHSNLGNSQEALDAYFKAVELETPGRQQASKEMNEQGMNTFHKFKQQWYKARKRIRNAS
jgi:tetratricopeptide (TPR) repeat protein